MNKMKDVMNQVCRERTDLHVLNEEELSKIRRVYLNMADDILSQVQENYYNPPYFKENYWDKVVDYLS